MDWDASAVRSPYGHVLQSEAWGKIRSRQGWEAERLRIGDPLPVALVLWRRLPLGQRFGYVPRGPVFDHGDAAQLDAALSALSARARERGATFLKVDPEISLERSDLLATYARHGFARSPQDVQPVVATLELDLRRSEDELLGRFDRDTRWSIRTAERRGVEVAERSDEDALADFGRLYGETGRRAGFIVRTPAYYRDVWRTLLDDGHASLLLATNDGRSVAGAMVLWCGDRALYMYGASDEAARRVYATYLLQWRCIRRAKERGAARYDFGGVPARPAESDRLYGVSLFKKGFGGERREFAGAYDIAPRPLAYRLWLLAEPRAYALVAFLAGRLRRSPRA